MPRARRRAPRARKEYSRVEILRLACGIALGADRFGSGPDAMNLMRTVWRNDEELRARTYGFFEYRRAQGRPLVRYDYRTAKCVERTEPWGATKFDIPGDHRDAEPLRNAEQDAEPIACRVTKTARANRSSNRNKTQR